MSSLLSDKSIEKIRPLRSILLRAAVWVFIAGVVISVIAILFSDDSSSKYIWKLLGTLFVLALAMVISVNNFKRIESKRADVQGFAMLGLISNILWAIAWILLIWEVFSYLTPCSTRYNCYTELSFFTKFAFIASSLSFLGLLGSNIMAIYEGSKKNAIFPIKITAIVCLAYEEIYSICTIIKSNLLPDRLGVLAGFCGVVWFIATIIALVIASSAKRADGIPKKDTSVVADDVQTAPVTPIPTAVKSDDELRTEIEARVRAEMETERAKQIEEEVRAKLAAEQSMQPEQPIPSEYPEN